MSLSDKACVSGIGETAYVRRASKPVVLLGTFKITEQIKCHSSV